MNTIIQLPGLTIDISALRSVFSADGLPQWSGKVVLTFDDSIDGTTTTITANWAGQEERAEGMLVDFEDEAEDDEERGMLPLYKACEVFAEGWSKTIAKHLGRPSQWDAHQNDLRERGMA